jgi:hypothetical protein
MVIVVIAKDVTCVTQCMLYYAVQSSHEGRHASF